MAALAGFYAQLCPLNELTIGRYLAVNLVFMTQRDLNQPTRGQVERVLSQRVQKFYRDQLGHSTGKVTCQLRNDNVTIVVESSLTQPEQLLLEDSKDARAEQLRSDLDEAVRPRLVDLIETTLRRKVVDLMSDTTLTTGRTSFVAILSPNSDELSSRQPIAETIANVS